MILDSINNPKDVKKLNLIEQEELAKELRDKIITTVSTNGGHLASNLGVVELSIAIDYVFNFPNDKIVWDVGHQCYVHKILTGRKDEFDTLRKYKGLSGFPKSCESSYDHFNTGHSSTSISAALGMARARDLNHGTEKVIAVIGDGALTGGMAFEALNDAGISKTNLLVILNDNEMSISKNVGGLSLILSKLRTKKTYLFVGGKGKSFVDKIPFFGKHIVNLVRKIKRILKQMFISNMIFEDMGYRYFGPVDGHDLKQLEYILDKIKDLEGPVLLHVKTKKGKGYKPAEENPDIFHATGKFDIKTGKKESNGKPDYSKAFGDSLIKVANHNHKVVAVTAAMKDGTGLTEFSQKFPDRFFDVGIAEQHAITMAAGMAKSGLIPVVPIYSSFLQRAYDQMLHDVAMQNLHVVICADRSGVVGADGETHQGLFDMSFTNTIPNFTIMAPKNYEELDLMLEYSVENIEGPVLIRYPRGTEDSLWQQMREDANKKILDLLRNNEREIADEELAKVTSKPIEYGKAEVLREGTDFVIIAIGKMVARGLKVAQELEQKGVSVAVINARFLKPLDKITIWNYIEKVRKVITIEDGSSNNGLSQMVKNLISDNMLSETVEKPVKRRKILGFSKHIEQLENKIYFKEFSYPCTFIKQGDYDSIDKEYSMRKEDIIAYILENYHEEKSLIVTKNDDDFSENKKTNIFKKIINKIKTKAKKKDT